MKFTDEEGKVWEWRGEYKIGQAGDYYLSEFKSDGGIGQVVIGHHQIRAIVHPVPTIHEFGGVKFEEGDRGRKAKAGEWSWDEDGDGVVYWGHASYYVQDVILRPLQGEK